MTIVKSSLVVAFSCSLLCLSFPTLAQELNLFQEIVDLPPPQPRQANRQALPEQMNADPAFTLRATSRFGDTYHASLISRNGAAVNIQWQSGESSEIEGFNGFSVVEIGSRTATIRLPANESCVSSLAQGVECADNASIALLQLSTAPAISNPTDTNDEFSSSFPPADSVTEQAESEPVFFTTRGNVREFTPEQILAISERQQRRAERLNALDTLTIADDEIPEGMTIVRTPFGDRLIPSGE